MSGWLKMDSYWNKLNSLSNRKKEAEVEQQETKMLTFREGEVENWDFQADSTNQNRFAFSKRQPDLDNYRVLGSQVAQAKKFAPTPKISAKAGPSRPNRYNSSVRMVAGDGGPAPWDWENVRYSRMPIAGEVAAGRYDVTIAYHEPCSGPDADYVMVNTSEVKLGQASFALRVRGQSMIDNEIDNGDVIIVQAQNWADDGDFVIACLTDSTDPNGFVTLKRFYRHRQADRVVLQPANPNLSPIHILPNKGDRKRDDLDGVKIQGRVTAIIKMGGLV